MRKISHFRDGEEEVRKKVPNNWNVGKLSYDSEDAMKILDRCQT